MALNPGKQNSLMTVEDLKAFCRGLKERDQLKAYHRQRKSGLDKPNYAVMEAIPNNCHQTQTKTNRSDSSQRPTPKSPFKQNCVKVTGSLHWCGPR